MGWLGGCRRAGLGVGASQCSPFVLPAASPAARGGDPAGKCALGTAKGQPRGTSRIHWVSGWAKLRSVKLISWLWLDPTSSTASSFPTLSTVPHSMPWFESRWIGAWSWSLEHSTPLTFENNPRFVTTPRLLNLPRPGSCSAPPGQPCAGTAPPGASSIFQDAAGKPWQLSGPPWINGKQKAAGGGCSSTGTAPSNAHRASLTPKAAPEHRASSRQSVPQHFQGLVLP